MSQNTSHNPHTKPVGQKAEVAASKTSARPAPALAGSAFPRLPGGTALSMSPIHKPGLMTQMSHISKPGQTPTASHTQMQTPTQTPASAAYPPKYAKIQPAIAIKPRPLAVAPAPAASVKSTFNPRYTPTKSATSSQAVPDADMSAINTSRTWVLPPRPRPGRKPTSGPASSDDERKPSASASHKKQKQQKQPKQSKQPKRGSPNLSSGSASAASTSASPTLTFKKGTTPTASSPPSSVPSTPGSHSRSGVSQKNAPKTNSGSNAAKTPGSSAAPRMSSTHLKSRPGSVASPHAAAPLAAKEIPNSPAPARVAELQKIYLAKLKEQELVQNYIDILGNQIKELKFVQSGVITFDALNSNRHETAFPGPNSAKSRNASPSDQLDHINNVRDLDAFLAHLTTQSNVIHSATKKFIGDSSKDGSHVQSQLKHYLELKANKAGARAPQVPSLGREYSPFSSFGGSGFDNPEVHNADFSTGDQLTTRKNTVSSNTGAPESIEGSRTSSFFTAGFLRPLNVSSLDHDAGTLSVDIINERDPFSGSMGSLEKKRADSMAEEDVEMLARSLEFKQQQDSKGVKKLGCGFCSGETPCLCFDADLLLTEK